MNVRYNLPKDKLGGPWYWVYSKSKLFRDLYGKDYGFAWPKENKFIGMMRSIKGDYCQGLHRSLRKFMLGDVWCNESRFLK